MLDARTLRIKRWNRAISRAAIALRFDPDQPRDDHGRWGEGGGGSSGGKTGGMSTKQVEEAARLGVTFHDKGDGLILAKTADGEEYYIDHPDQIDPMLSDIRDRQGASSSPAGARPLMGHGGDAPGTSPGSTSGWETHGVDMEAVGPKVGKFEIENVRNVTNERCISLDKNGKVLLKKEGDPNKISLSASDVEKSKDSIHIHNHPNGTSFSESDVAFAMRADVLEARVVGTDFDTGESFVHVITRPVSGWPDPKSVIDTFSGELENARDDANMKSPLERSDKKRAALKRDIRHSAWERTFRDHGVLYVRAKAKVDRKKSKAY